MDSVINNIIDTINNSDWSINKKIRYAYLELGKNIHKNVEFFYTIFNKLSTGKYTASEIMDIYTSEIATDNVICRDVVLMLKKIFDSCGIESEIRKFSKIQEYIVDGESLFIQHYISVVKGDFDKYYFLSLVPDIANIQLGFNTEHFGNNIEYLDDKDNQIYEGEKVDNSLMDLNELKEIDRELGFLSLKLDDNEVYEYMDEAFKKLSSILNYKNITPLIRNVDNVFYMDLVKCLNTMSGNNEIDSLSCELSKISDSDWDIIKKHIFKRIIPIIEKKCNFEISDGSLKTAEELISNNDYDMFFKNLKSYVSKVDDQSTGLFNIKAIVSNLYNMLRTIDNFKEIDNYSSKQFIDLKRKFDELIDKLGILFVDKKYFYVEDKKFTNGYIVNKLKCYLPLIFDLGHQTKFSNMGIGEKVVIMDKVLKMLLEELREDNLMPHTKSDFLDNRTYRTVIKDKETGSYLYMILIHCAGEYGNKVLLYDFDLNLIKGFDENISFVQIISDERYEILSDRIYIEVEEMEEYRRNNTK